MEYKAIKVKMGKLGEPVEAGTIQSTDCWLVQISGLDACKNCDVKDTPDCGGGEMLKQFREQAK